MAEDFLLEIGTEEMPANDMNLIRQNFSKEAAELFSENRLEYKNLNVYSTPRRLTLYIEQLAEKQSDKKESVRGPAYDIAFDDEGNPTKAGEGFARGQGVEVEDLVVRNDYLYADKVEKGKKTSEILANIILDLMKNIDFPKAMRWGNIDFKFIRPIKWLLALFGTEKIDFEIAGVNSGRLSYGHRFLTDKGFEIDKPQNYFDILKDNYIIVDQKKRRKIIKEQINNLEEISGEVVFADNLLAEVVDLLEYPTAFCGSFSEEYLKIPEDVLITSMVEHQRYFPVRKKSGELDNLFVGVRDGNEEYLETVKKGNEMVLKARLADAQFFFEEDQKENFENLKNDLKDVVFKEELGTMYDKVLRLEKLSKKIADEYNLSEEKTNNLIRAAELSKNDLLTEMVNEFAKLQGIMGAEYADLAGENKEVVEGIREHYLPRFAGDKLPQTIIGSILSLTDKLDNITAHYGLGIKPSGSQDPFALRRQASSIVRIILDLRKNVKISKLIEYSLNILDIENNELLKEVKELLLQRLRNELEEMELRYDVINAAISIKNDDFVDLKDRAEAVMKVRKDNPELFVDLFRGLVRAKNLGNKADKKLEIDENLFETEEEKNLYKKYISLKEKIKNKYETGDYKTALKRLVEFKKPVDLFLDNVIVMVDNKKLRENRLALLQKVSKISEIFIDIDEIALDD
ncbi:MAG: glycine--tRNA ligase subunit beta [Bacillota bacterium]